MHWKDPDRRRGRCPPRPDSELEFLKTDVQIGLRRCSWWIVTHKCYLSDTNQQEYQDSR